MGVETSQRAGSGKCHAAARSCCCCVGTADQSWLCLPSKLCVVWAGLLPWPNRQAFIIQGRPTLLWHSLLLAFATANTNRHTNKHTSMLSPPPCLPAQSLPCTFLLEMPLVTSCHSYTPHSRALHLTDAALNSRQPPLLWLHSPTCICKYCLSLQLEPFTAIGACHCNFLAYPCRRCHALQLAAAKIDTVRPCHTDRPSHSMSRPPRATAPPAACVAVCW
jgi:hypothetical protein